VRERIAVSGRIRFVFAALRFRADGRPDRRFGNDGLLPLAGAEDSTGRSALALPDGKVVAGGGPYLANSVAADFSLVLARYSRRSGG
jgi:hypothetical protein